MAQVKRAYRDGSGNLQTTSTVATMAYDALGRRVVKDIDNCADWDATYHTYYDGWRRVELRDGSDQVLKQWVWGLQYVDELIRTDLNQDPIDTSEQICERAFWTAQDANFNVLGVFTRGGGLVERYEYTPYGRRTVYSHGWSIADLDEDGDVDSIDNSLYTDILMNGGTDHQERLADCDANGAVNGLDNPNFIKARGSALDHGNDDLVTHPVLASARYTTLSLGQSQPPLCDIGHQGLSLDREFGAYDNRTRIYLAKLARHGQRDKAGYADGQNSYLYTGSNPIDLVDPYGLWKIERDGKPKAKACAEEGDTISTLADVAGFVDTEFRDWLSTNSSGTIITEGGPKTLFHIALTDPIAKDQPVFLPNTIFAHWGGAMGDFGKSWVEWNSDIDKLKERGFAIEERNAQTDVQFRIDMHLLAAKKEMHGMFFWGHGIPERKLVIPRELYYTGKRDAEGNWYVKERTRWDKRYYELDYTKPYVGLFLDHNKGDAPYDIFRQYVSRYDSWNLPYRLPFGILWACGSQDALLWDVFVPKSQNPNSIFAGYPHLDIKTRKQIPGYEYGWLIPTPLHSFGPTIEETVPRGAQGTK